MAKSGALGNDVKHASGKSPGEQHPGNIQKQASGVSFGGGKGLSAAEPPGPSQQQVDMRGIWLSRPPSQALLKEQKNPLLDSS